MLEKWRGGPSEGWGGSVSDTTKTAVARQRRLVSNANYQREGSDWMLIAGIIHHLRKKRRRWESRFRRSTSNVRRQRSKRLKHLTADVIRDDGGSKGHGHQLSRSWNCSGSFSLAPGFGEVQWAGMILCQAIVRSFSKFLGIIIGKVPIVWCLL